MKSTLIAALLLTLIISFIRFYTPLMIFIDLPSMFLVCATTALITVSRYGISPLIKSEPERLKALDFISKISPIAGIISSIIGMVQMLQLMSLPAMIGPSLAVCLLSLLYGALISLVALVYKTSIPRISSTLFISGGYLLGLVSLFAVVIAFAQKH